MSQYAPAARLNRPVVADLRSDTVTQPCDGMRAAMAAAEVGDDVYGDDPTVTRLEAVLAERLGKDAAVFLPSGTQSNLCAMLSHCGRGEEVMAGESYHVIRYEAAGASVLGGISLQSLPVAEDGALEAADIADAVRDGDYHHPLSRLLSLENTTYGRAVSLPRMEQAVQAGRAAGLSLHLDGARFFNAITALGCSAPDMAGSFDTVSICLSKGLGAPVGSVLVGQADLIDRARRWRKMLGGGLRQVGVLAAAGLYAMEHNAPRLSEDHARAEALAQHLRDLDIGEVSHATNMVFFTPRTGIRLSALAAEYGVRLAGSRQDVVPDRESEGHAPKAAETTRMVLHRDVDDAALQTVMAAFTAAAQAREVA